MTTQTHTQTPLERLRHHVTGAIERGESAPVVEITTPAKHTNGPWEFALHATPESCPQFGVYAKNGNGRDLAHVVFHGTDRHAEIQANARLIAAAPDLLEALRFISAEIGGGGTACEKVLLAWKRRAVEAIAKAEGGQE